MKLRLSFSYGLLAGLLLAAAPGVTLAQTGNLGVGTSTPHPSAALEVASTGKGLLMPRLTQAQRTAIQAPAPGLIVYQTDGAAGFWYYSGTQWLPLQGSSAADDLGNHTATQNLQLGTNLLTGSGGTNGLRIGADGQAMISTTNPGSGFANWIATNVGGAVGDRVVSGLLFGVATVGGHDYGLTAWAPLALNPGGGNVGIGTSAPSQPLHVAGQVFSSAGGFRFPDNTVQTTAAVLTKSGTTISLSSGGAVTDSDNQTLSISGNTISLTNGGSVTVTALADNLGNHTATQNLNLGFNQLVGNGGSSGLRISNNGNVGVGTLFGPLNRLHIDGGDLRLGQAVWHSAADDRFLRIGDGDYVMIGEGGGDDKLEMRAQNFVFISSRGTGNVGIGISAPAEKLHVAGNAYVNGNLTAGGNIVGGGNIMGGSLSTSGDLTAGGTLTVVGTVSFCRGAYTCSDRRYKKDITPLRSALENVLKLNGYTYFWKQTEFPEKQFTADRQLGFIAQEVEALYPEMVMTDPKTGYKSVDYSRMTPVLLEAVKELKRQLDEQTRRAARAEAALDSFESRLRALEAGGARAGEAAHRPRD